MHKYKNYLVDMARENRRAYNLSEALLWDELKQKKLGLSFTKQKPIGKYIADFYCAEKNLVIEVDGCSHDNGKYEYDKKREEYMESLGIFILRILDEDVRKDMPNVLAWIKDTVDNL